VSDYTREEFPVYASGDGVVLAVEDGMVLIELDGGHFVRNFHLFDIAVKAGDRVAHGQVIGRGRGW
jgi:murein DD-endopeptidase MepM/ murein hydrolase activator NlpD